MARPLEYPGAIYHVTSRGNALRAVFLDDKDRENFLEILSLVVKRYNWLCHGYSLMDNHYHLLIETPDANLSKGMRQLNEVYTQTFNRIHKEDYLKVHYTTISKALKRVELKNDNSRSDPKNL
jgi:REP element-mobilizing transposase RayT